MSPANSLEFKYVVCDIENRSDGSVIAIDTFDGNQHYIHYNWEAWLDFIGTMSRKNPCYKKIYAHNGGAWDWLSFIEWAIANESVDRFSTVENGNRIIALRFRHPNGTTINLCDSLFLLNSSLEKASQKYLGKGKVKIEHLPEWYWENDRENFYKYLRGDTENLYDVLREFVKVIFRIAPIGSLGLTLPSTAMKCFRTGFLQNDIYTPSNEQCRLFMREGYMGGRVEVFRSGRYKHINVYDFNSLYPTVMHYLPLPTEGEPQYTRKYERGDIGVYRIRYNQTNRKLLPVFINKGKGSYKGEGTFFTPEIERYTRTGGTLEVIDGYVFKKCDVIFREYVDTLYRLRLTDLEGPLGNTCKMLMNSLYGKFAQVNTRSSTMFIPPEDIRKLRDKGATIHEVNPEHSIYKVSIESLVPFQHVGISGLITSEARAKLWESFDKDTIYCDTDSIHTPNTKAVGTNLGDLKLEFSGEGVYVGKKLYALRNDKVEKVKAKGIRVGGELGFSLDFEGLTTLLKGSKIVCDFKSATTSNEVMKGKGTACRFRKKTRTIRMTV